MRAVYLERVRIKPPARKRLKVLLSCQHGARARHLSRLYRGEMKERRRDWLRIRRVTPYRCSGRRFAVPCYIVQCESRFDPNADNGSHFGFYQLQYSYLGGDRSVAHQHVVAARLWRGGAGRSHWVCA